MGYGILNAALDFHQAPDDVKGAFLGRRAEKRLLPVGYELYKYTEHTLYNGNQVTAWWSSVKPLAPNDPGFEESLVRANRLGAAPHDFARARAAVTTQWNAMDKLLRARLIQPVYGFAGQCAHQPVNQGQREVLFIGGAYQLWIPGLTRAEIVPA